MLNSKSYGLQNETRQYLRRLYSNGRELVGADIVDIDDFILGMKQLNLWQSVVCWLLRSQQNIGTGSTVLSLGSLGKNSYDGVMINSPTWGSSGVTFGGAVNAAKINLPLDIRFQISYSASIFGCLNYQAGVIQDNNFSIFTCQDLDGDPAFPTLHINHQASQGVIPFVTRGITKYLQSTRGGAFLTGFSTVVGTFESNVQSNYRNGVLIARESSLGTINPATRLLTNGQCYIGRGNYVTGGVTVPISLVSSKILSNTSIANIHYLYKTTIGKNLGLS